MSAILVGFQQYEAELLSLVRYQLMVAGQQSAQMAPLSSLALGSMQDAVESMLSLVVEHEHVVISNRNDFLQLFDAVAATVAGDPPISGYRPGAAAMNLARVNFKHHGNQAEASTIARHLGNSTDLVATLTDRVFGVRLDSISLLLFIRDDETRQHLEDAQTNLNAGKLEDAMTELKLAFDRLIHDYEQRKAWHPGKSLFSTKPSFAPSQHSMRDHGKDMERVVEWLESLDGWVKMLALGVDMRRYAHFEAHTPVVHHMMDGGVHVVWREGSDVTDEVFARCFKFVVDTALAFAEDDFDFDAWAARQAARPAEDIE